MFDDDAPFLAAGSPGAVYEKNAQYLGDIESMKTS
jgi:hypothetical protein